MDEDGTFRITAKQLLANASDPDGDPLHHQPEMIRGKAWLSNADGSWTFTPATDWNGEVAFGYSIVDEQDSLDSAINQRDIKTKDSSIFTH